MWINNAQTPLWLDTEQLNVPPSVNVFPRLLQVQMTKADLCPEPGSKGKTLWYVLICCNLCKIFDWTIRGRHQHLTPQRTVLPQHFSKQGLSIEAATLHRLRHTSPCFGGCSFHISGWMGKLKISVAILNRMNKPRHASTKLSSKSHWRGNRGVFFPWNTHLIYEGLLVFVAVSCGKEFFLEEVSSLEKANTAGSCRAGQDAIHQLTRQGQHPFSHNSFHIQYIHNPWGYTTQWCNNMKYTYSMHTNWKK